MSKRSKVYELPSSLIKQINEALLSKKLTLKNLKTFINSHKLNNGVVISDSSLGRYKQAFDHAAKDFQALENLIKSLPQELNFNQENELHKLVYKILNKAVLDNSLGKELKSQEIMMLARATKDLMASTKDREKIKQELEKEIKNEQAEELKKANRAGEIPTDVFEHAMRIMGFKLND